MLNKIFEIIFQRKINIVCDIEGVYKYRDFKDGVTVFEFIIECDFYISDHNPKLNFFFRLFNHNIISIEFYNIYHKNYQQRIDKWSLDE